LAFLNVAARHDAVDWRFDAHLAEIVTRAFERRAFLIDAARLRRHLLFALLNRRFGGLAVVFRAIERLASGELLAPEIALACQRLLRLLQLDACRFDRLPELIERRFRRLQRRVAAVDARAQRLRIDLQEELAFPDSIA